MLERIYNCNLLIINSPEYLKSILKDKCIFDEICIIAPKPSFNKPHDKLFYITTKFTKDINNIFKDIMPLVNISTFIYNSPKVSGIITQKNFEIHYSFAIDKEWKRLNNYQIKLNVLSDIICLKGFAEFVYKRDIKKEELIGIAK
jgi:hypothetical protein